MLGIVAGTPPDIVLQAEIYVFVLEGAVVTVNVGLAENEFAMRFIFRGISLKTKVPLPTDIVLLTNSIMAG